MVVRQRSRSPSSSFIGSLAADPRRISWQTVLDLVHNLIYRWNHQSVHGSVHGSGGVCARICQEDCTPVIVSVPAWILARSLLVGL